MSEPVPPQPDENPGDDNGGAGTNAPQTAPQASRLSLLKRLLLLKLGVLCAAGFVMAAAYAWLDAWVNAAGSLGAETFVVIEPGSGLSSISESLYYAGVIEHPQRLVLWARLHGMGRNLKAGEYRFRPGASPRAALARMQAGDVVVHHMLIPEGLTTREIYDRLYQDDRLSGILDRFMPEGTLLPETYNFQRRDTRQSLVNRMETAMTNTVATLWEQRAEDLPFSTPEEAVILASIVEKETGIDNERAKVAGVFINRLNKGMRLQSDPTVIYALTEGKEPLGRPLTRADWRVDHPYNTYVIKGLPPGPIVHPGAASIEAVLNPARHNYIFFVADGSGGHAFSVTYDEHKRNIERLRAARRAEAN